MVSCNFGEIDLDVQGHRGCRGLMPENSLPGFERALELGATTLEMDVVISRDMRVVVSHEPWFDHFFCLDAEGAEIQAADELKNNIYQLDYSQIARFDCGSKGNTKYQQLIKIKTSKPLLSEVIEMVEARPKKGERPTRFNVEIKRQPEWDGIFHPPVEEFVALVLKELRDCGVMERSTISSFDRETLQVARRQSKEAQLGLGLDLGQDYKTRLSELGFYPVMIIPAWEDADRDMLAFAAEKHMKVVVWTVNEPKDMERLIDLGVHGIITDYPDRLVELLKRK